MIDVLITLLLISAIAAIALLGWTLHLELQRQQSPQQRSNSRARFTCHPNGNVTQNQPKRNTVTPKKPQSAAIPPNFEGRVLRLLQGDRSAALRLAERVKSNHPGRSEQWVWEKVIFDLERDRH